MCKVYYTVQTHFGRGGLGLSQAYYANRWHLFLLTASAGRRYYGINIFTHMPDPTRSISKREALQASGTFNPRHARVGHRLFQNSEFFDPQDLLQLKYESLRALQQEDYCLAQAASEFGLSRPTLYQAQAHFQAQGLEGLLPAKRGPKGAHKLRPQVLDQLRRWRTAEPALSARQLARRVRQRFKLKVHPRTLEKALKPKAKRGRPNL
jgi:transposase